MLFLRTDSLLKISGILRYKILKECEIFSVLLETEDALIKLKNNKYFNSCSNKLLSAMVNSSSVEDALISGLHGRSCNSYSPCPIQEHHMPLLMSNLALFTNAPDIYWVLLSSYFDYLIAWTYLCFCILIMKLDV